MDILDNHVHTNFSSDGKDCMESVILKAINLGTRYLTFTDHLEYNNDNFSLDLKKYFKTINEYKEKYKNDIELLIGVEVGYQTNIKDKIENIITSNPFDFVLCSTHTVAGVNVPDSKYFKELTQKEAYLKYFETMLKGIKEFENFDSYGHLDYIIRYGNYKNNKVIYSNYSDVLDEVLKNIISYGKGIELNTSGFRYGLDSIHPNESILKRYKELGGEIVTIGSDSHQANHLCKDFDKAYDMLLSLGFKYICLFIERTPCFLKLDKKTIKTIA